MKCLWVDLKVMGRRYLFLGRSKNSWILGLLCNFMPNSKNLRDVCLRLILDNQRSGVVLKIQYGGRLVNFHERKLLIGLIGHEFT